MFHCTQEKHHPFNARKKRTADTYVRTVLLIKSHDGELIHMVLISHAPPGRYKILNNRNPEKYFVKIEYGEYQIESIKPYNGCGIKKLGFVFIKMIY